LLPSAIEEAAGDRGWGDGPSWRNRLW
jgi:hypothetical protein